MTQQQRQNASVSVHDPDHSGTTTGEWSKPSMEDFDTDDLSDIADHFLVSTAGFPPEDYGDLALPVVETNGDLNLNALANAKSRASQTDGLSGDTLSRVETKIDNLANDNFEDANFGDDDDRENALRRAYNALGEFLRTNERPGDIVRWDPTDHRDVRYGRVADEDGEEVLVAIHTHDPSGGSPSTDGGSWSATGGTAMVAVDDVTRLKQFPASPKGKQRTNATEYNSGDVVDYGSGTGVVLEVMTSDFAWPQGDEDEIDVEASSDEPAYIVARESGGAKVFWADELSSGSFDAEAPNEDEMSDLRSNAHEYYAAWYDHVDDPDDADEVQALMRGNASVPGLDDPGVGFDRLPEGWTRKSVLQAYASLGGSWRSCVADMTGEIRSPKKFCSSLKDEVFQSERWRGRF